MGLEAKDVTHRKTLGMPRYVSMGAINAEEIRDQLLHSPHTT